MKLYPFLLSLLLASFVWSSCESSACDTYPLDAPSLPNTYTINGHDVNGPVPSFKAPATIKFEPDFHDLTFIEYLWDFGDGAVSGDSDPVHEFTTPGTYKITLAFNYRENCYDEYGGVYPDYLLKID